MSFVEECLQSHNKYRARHGAGPLELKEDLTQHAQRWANYLAKSGKFQHSRDSNFGENIAMTSGSNPTGGWLLFYYFFLVQFAYLPSFLG